MVLDPSARAAFGLLADTLIPADGPMPSATAAGVAGELIDRVLGFRPDLAEAFGAAVDSYVGQDPEAALDGLAADHPDRFEALSLLTAGAYFLSPQVKAALGHSPAPRAVRDDVDDYVDLLEAVLDRGFDIH